MNKIEIVGRRRRLGRNDSLGVKVFLNKVTMGNFVMDKVIENRS